MRVARPGGGAHPWLRGLLECAWAYGDPQQRLGVGAQEREVELGHEAQHLAA
ncbi:hypothetical protein [Streptomyces sp. NPDC001604]|uniref:hypothetical protein n=1 Tax=Streptomyces sp. NPDC001604 TaxID=3364593 RepID=UPI0036A32D07